MSVVELGGARVAEASGGAICSASQVRRMLAGELVADELVLAEAHVAGCARCTAVRAEVERERVELAKLVPFESFAAGVAEKLARDEGAKSTLVARVRPRWNVTSRILASAASVAVIGLVGLLFASGAINSRARPGDERTGRGVASTPTALADRQGLRTKGAAAISVFALRASRSFALAESEKSEPGDRLLPALEPAGRAFATVALVEGDEVSLLYRGPARPGPLPEAFEWTGGAREARLVAVYSDELLDGEAVVAAIKSNVAPGKGAEVVERKLSR